MLMQPNPRESENLTERAMLGLSQPLLICSLDEGKVKDTALNWIQGRRQKEEEDDDR